MSGGWDSDRGACCETCYTERIQKYEDHPCKLVIYRTKGVPSWGSGGATGVGSQYREIKVLLQGIFSITTIIPLSTLYQWVG